VSTLRVSRQALRPFFTPKALAEYLSISERTVRQMLAEGRIPSYRVEGARRIDPDDVDAYLARNRNGRA
jgi:excisionase family DNA binding protein